MKNQRRPFRIIAVVGAVIAAALVFGFYSGNSDSGSSYTESDVREIFSVSDQNHLFMVIEQEFPQEFQNIVSAMVAIANDKSFSISETEIRLFEKMRELTTELSKNNAHLLVHAPISVLREIKSASLKVHESLRHKKDKCAAYAVSGPKTLSIHDFNDQQIQLLTEIGVLTFLAIAEARKNPVTHPDLTQRDRNEIAQLWIQRPTVTYGMQDALFGSKYSHPEYCAASVDFNRFIVGTLSREMDHFVVEVFRVSAGQ
ncbi:MAG: hypothetical protein GY947_11785 [Rhodobacteraceae bacterium]|nr:hypothetical protein [Paracoccaceae bacterium]